MFVAAMVKSTRPTFLPNAPSTSVYGGWLSVLFFPAKVSAVEACQPLCAHVSIAEPCCCGTPRNCWLSMSVPPEVGFDTNGPRAYGYATFRPYEKVAVRSRRGKSCL